MRNKLEEEDVEARDSKLLSKQNYYSKILEKIPVKRSGRGYIEIIVGVNSYANKYKELQKIGEGSYSVVMKSKQRNTSEKVAVKKLKHSYRDKIQVEDIPEVKALRKLPTHPNILQLLETHFDPSVGRVCLVFELMEMNLYELIKDRKKLLGENRVKGMVFQLIRGLRHLHKNGIFHRDVKPENILIETRQGGDLLKLADLGSVRVIFSNPPYTEYISTRWYRSPECLLTSGRYNVKMDVWAAGCVFYELLTLRPLFPGSSEIDQITKIHNLLGIPSDGVLQKFTCWSHQDNDSSSGYGSSRHLKQSRFESIKTVLHGLRTSKSRRSLESYLNGKQSPFSKVLPSHITQEAHELLKLMLQYDPENRPSSHRVLQHSYFKGLRNLAMNNREAKLSPTANDNKEGSKVIMETNNNDDIINNNITKSYKSQRSVLPQKEPITHSVKKPTAFQADLVESPSCFNRRSMHMHDAKLKPKLEQNYNSPDSDKYGITQTNRAFETRLTKKSQQAKSSHPALLKHGSLVNSEARKKALESNNKSEFTSQRKAIPTTKFEPICHSDKPNAFQADLVESSACFNRRSMQDAKLKPKLEQNYDSPDSDKYRITQTNQAYETSTRLMKKSQQAKSSHPALLKHGSFVNSEGRKKALESNNKSEFVNQRKALPIKLEPTGHSDMKRSVLLSDLVDEPSSTFNKRPTQVIKPQQITLEQNYNFPGSDKYHTTQTNQAFESRLTKKSQQAKVKPSYPVLLKHGSLINSEARKKALESNNKSEFINQRKPLPIKLEPIGHSDIKRSVLLSDLVDEPCSTFNKRPTQVIKPQQIILEQNYISSDKYGKSENIPALEKNFTRRFLGKSKLNSFAIHRMNETRRLLNLEPIGTTTDTKKSKLEYANPNQKKASSPPTNYYYSTKLVKPNRRNFNNEQTYFSSDEDAVARIRQKFDNLINQRVQKKNTEREKRLTLDSDEDINNFIVRIEKPRKIVKKTTHSLFQNQRDRDSRNYQNPYLYRIQNTVKKTPDSEQLKRFKYSSNQFI